MAHTGLQKFRLIGSCTKNRGKMDVKCGKFVK